MATKTNAIMKKKEKLAKKINSMLRKTALSFIKDLNKLMKSEGVWYSTDDIITRYDNFHKPNDMNADQLFIDHITSALNECFVLVEPNHLWTKDDIENPA